MTEMIDMTGNGDFVPAAPSAQQAASIVPSTVAGMALGDGLDERVKKIIADASIGGVGLRILARNCNILGNGTTIETYSRNGETYLVLDGWNCVAPGGTAQPAPILSATVETWEDRMSRSGRRECESLAIELMQAEIADWRALVAPPAQPITPELNEPTAALVEQLNNYAGNSGYSHGDYADTMKQAAHCIGQLVGCVELYQRKYAESCARELAAQPIADVSAPTVEKLMADMDTMRDEFASLSRALTFWLPRVPSEPGPIQDRVVHDAFFLTDGEADDKCAEELGWITLNVADVSAPTDDLTLFDIDLMAKKFPLPETRYNGCGDGSEPLYTPEMVYAYAHQHIVAMAHARKPELDKALAAARAAAPVSPTYEELAADLKSARATIRVMDKNKAAYLARNAELESAAPVSGQAASIRYDAQFCALVFNYMTSGGVGAEGKRSYDALVQHIDSRPRSEDSRAEVLGAVENIVLQQCTGMAAKDIRLSRILAAIRALATTAAPERSGQAAQEQAAPALTDADRLLIVAFIHREMVDTVRAHGEVACARFLNKWQTPAELDKKLVAHLYADTQAKGGAA